MEVETSFVDRNGSPMTRFQSQQLFWKFREMYPLWRINAMKTGLITELIDCYGNKMLYELGRQNIEFSIVAGPSKDIIFRSRRLLDNLYIVANNLQLFPYFQPVLKTDQSLLIIPDSRDAIWLELDGQEALELLARISAVQFTISVPPNNVIDILNRLGENIGLFLMDYPQEENWRRYIHESKAGYHPMRYGGPLFFKDMHDYCKRLLQHDVVVGPKLVPHSQVEALDIPLFIRSVWWYFRLRRYGDTLCIEIRPLARRDDDYLQQQLDFVLSVF